MLVVRIEAIASISFEFRWGPLGDHTSCLGPNNPQMAERHSDKLNATELQSRLLPRPGGQGVAGSNPAVPTRTCRSEGVSEFPRGSFSIFGSQTGSHSLTRTWHSRGFGLLLEDLVHGRCALGQRGQLSAPNLTLDAANRTNYSRRQRSRAGGDL